MSILKRKQDKKPISVIVDREMRQNMEREAARRRVSLSDVVRETLAEKWG